MGLLNFLTNTLELEKGTEEQVKNGEAQIIRGLDAIETKQDRTLIGAKYEKVTSLRQGEKVTTVRTVGGTPITHRTVTYLSKDDKNNITSAKRVVFIITEDDKGEKVWRPAAVSNDGGKTYQFEDEEYPLMSTGGPNGGPVAGEGLRNDLSNTQDGSAIRKQIDKKLNDALDEEDAYADGGENNNSKSNAIDSIKNNADQTDVDPTPENSDSEAESKDEVNPDDIKKPTDIGEKLLPMIKDKAGTRSDYGGLIYPIDLGLTTQDVIKFSMLKYIPSNVTQGAQGAFGFADNKGGVDFTHRQILGTVILPIPGGIKDDNRVNWTPNNANALEIALANLALNTIARGQEGATASIKNIVDALSGPVGQGETRDAIATAMAGLASGMGGQLITRTTGAILNPNMELLFNGPSLRSFNFQFVLSAREPDEAKMIARIIRFFKQGSSVKRTEGNLFLKSPHTFRIQYLRRNTSNDDNPFMNRIKEVACTGVSVNYTPQNNYAPFDDGAMTSYGLTLNFQELMPVFDDEYAELGENEIGF